MHESGSSRASPPRSAARTELWESLAALEDALSTGFHGKRPRPDFSSLDSHAPSQTQTIPPVHSQPPAGTFSAASPADPAAALEDLRERALECEACGLARTRNTVVFGAGVPQPAVLVIGEGPGAEEDRQGLPFVGPSGQLLDRMLAAIGLSRETNCYIANIVKCRPPGNREPAPDEKRACIGFLHEQVRLLKPGAILCAGRTAAQGILGTDEGINRLRGRDLAFEGIPLVATYHPSALLRDESLKRPAWEDMKRLRDILADGITGRGQDA